MRNFKGKFTNCLIGKKKLIDLCHMYPFFQPHNEVHFWHPLLKNRPILIQSPSLVTSAKHNCWSGYSYMFLWASGASRRNSLPSL